MILNSVSVKTRYNNFIWKIYREKRRQGQCENDNRCVVDLTRRHKSGSVSSGKETNFEWSPKSKVSFIFVSRKVIGFSGYIIEGEGTGYGIRERTRVVKIMRGKK